MVHCLNQKCGLPLPGVPMHMNSADMRQLKPPNAGDVAICAGCGMIMIFIDSAYNLRIPTMEEARLIGENKEIMTIRQRLLDRL